jgi:hypothetical protein
MRSPNKTKAPLARLALIFLVMMTAGIAQGEYDPDSVLQDATFKDQIQKITSDEAGRQSMLNHGTSAFGLTKTMFDFAAEVAAGDYTEQIETIMEVPTQQWNFSRGAMGSYDIVNVKQTVMQNQSNNLFGRVKDDMGNLATALSIYAVLKDVYDGHNGNDASKLKAMKGTYDLVQGYWAQRIGWSSLGTAMLGAGVIGYALDTFMNTAIGGYEQEWWDQYVLYMENRYQAIVTGDQSWAALAEREGNEGLRRRLFEFWETPFADLEGTAISKPFMAQTQFSEKFAALYYRDYIHTTLKTFFANKAEENKARAWFEGQQAHRRLAQAEADLRALKAAIEDARLNEQGERFLLLIPVVSELKVGESVTLKAVIENADGSEEEVTGATKFSGAAAGPTFLATETGTFYIEAVYDGVTGRAKVTVTEPDEEEDGEDGDELDEAIDDLTEEGEDEAEDFCAPAALSDARGLLEAKIADAQYLASLVANYERKFNKELADAASDPCNNSLMAYCYTSAVENAAELDVLVGEIRDAATELLMTLALCPDAQDAAGQPISTVDLISALSSVGSARGQAEQALAAMQARLGENACDEEEFEELSDQYVQEGVDPDALQDGSGMSEIGGDGVDNDQDGLQEETWEEVAGKNVTIVVYDSGNLKDDVFGLSVSGVGNLGVTPAGGLRTFGLNLEPGTYTATITVIVAPDNCGTVTAVATENGVQIGAFGTGQGCPAQGASLSFTFTVTGGAEE